MAEPSFFLPSDFLLRSFARPESFLALFIGSAFIEAPIFGPPKPLWMSLNWEFMMATSFSAEQSLLLASVRARIFDSLSKLALRLASCTTLSFAALSTAADSIWFLIASSLHLRFSSSSSICFLILASASSARRLASASRLTLACCSL